jgi:hypothetical protein
MTHYYFDHDGQPISLEQWAALLERDDRTIAEDTIGDHTIKTMYLGLVDPIVNARLFGTAQWTSSHFAELETYDSKPEALAGHRRHVEALRTTGPSETR